MITKYAQMHPVHACERHEQNQRTRKVGNKRKDQQATANQENCKHQQQQRTD
jgi:hypothetical protein